MSGQDRAGAHVRLDADERAMFVSAWSEHLPPAVSTVAGNLAGAPSGLLPLRLAASALGRFPAAFGTSLAAETDHGTGFLMIPLLMGLGALVYFSLSSEPGSAFLCGTAIGAFALCLLLRPWPRINAAAIALSLVLAGIVVAQWETRRAATPILGGDVTTRLTGRVEMVERLASGRLRLTLAVLATERPLLRYAPDRVRIAGRALPDGIHAGSVVKGLVRLRPPSGPLRPGAYDFAFESYFDGLGGNGFFLGRPELVPDVVAEPGLWEQFSAATENARNRFADRIRTRIGGVEGEIAAALVIGVRAGIPDPVNNALRRAGLSHILSISGLHMALVAAAVMGVFRGALALLPVLASLYPAKKIAAAAALAAILAYLFISGVAVAAERSFVMLAVMLGAVIADRAALTQRNLAIATTIVIVWSPHEAVGPSFQMSFAATAALVGAYGIWTGRRPIDGPRPAEAGLPRRLTAWLGRHLAGAALTSAIAGVATAIYGIHHFQRVSPLSLPANLTAMPIVSAIVMPAAIAAVALMPFGLDGPALDAMGKGLTGMVAVAQWYSERSPYDAAGTVPPGAVAVLTIALVVAALLSTRLRLAAVPLVAIGLGWFALRSPPDVLVSEDARLVAMPLENGRLAVNRQRAPAFTMEDWQRATMTAGLAGPVIEEAQSATVIPGGGSVPGSERSAETRDQPFHCTGGLCIARHRSGALVAYAETVGAAVPACGQVAVLVIAEAFGGSKAQVEPCKGTDTVVITRRDLARRGSAAIRLRKNSGDPTTVAFAIGTIYRPWHQHRQFSRAARGLPDRAGKGSYYPKTRPDGPRAFHR